MKKHLLYIKPFPFKLDTFRPKFKAQSRIKKEEKNNQTNQ